MGSKTSLTQCFKFRRLGASDRVLVILHALLSLSPDALPLWLHCFDYAHVAVVNRNIVSLATIVGLIAVLRKDVVELDSPSSVSVLMMDSPCCSSRGSRFLISVHFILRKALASGRGQPDQAVVG
jgi:hypothetical protein